MRGIKFRAWVKSEKMITSVSNLGLKINEEEARLYQSWVYWPRLPYSTFFEAPKKLLSSNQYELMEYTGLTDKNNKEIYEGDILKFDDSEIGGAKGIGIVEWWDDFTLVRNPGWYIWIKHQGIENRQFPFNREIIGNIYENKDLLK